MFACTMRSMQNSSLSCLSMVIPTLSVHHSIDHNLFNYKKSEKTACIVKSWSYSREGSWIQSPSEMPLYI